MLTRVVLLCLLVFNLCACTGLQYPEVPEYKLSRSGPFIISESPNLWRFFNRGIFQKKDLSVDVIVRNVSSLDHEIRLSEAKIDINGVDTPLACKTVQDETKSLQLKAGLQARIKCELKLTATSENKLGMKDTLLKVAIPSDADAIRVERLVRIEEIEK